MTQKGTFYKDAGRNRAKILPQEVAGSGVGVRSLGLAGDKIYLLGTRAALLELVITLLIQSLTEPYKMMVAAFLFPTSLFSSQTREPHFSPILNPG